MIALLAALFITSMEFSTDGGKTWDVLPPILEGTNAQFKLRVTWSGGDGRELLNGGFINESVNACGFERKSERAVRERVRAYVNAPPRPFVWNLDYSDLKPGTYKFTVSLFYQTLKEGRVSAERDFWIWRR